MEWKDLVSVKSPLPTDIRQLFDDSQLEQFPFFGADNILPSLLVPVSIVSEEANKKRQRGGYGLSPSPPPSQSDASDP